MKKLMPRKEASIEQIEKFLYDMQKQVDYFEDDRIQSEFSCLIEDMCKEYGICPSCFTKVDEVWYEEGLYRQCNCRSKRISA